MAGQDPGRIGPAQERSKPKRAASRSRPVHGAAHLFKEPKGAPHGAEQLPVQLSPCPASSRNCLSDSCSRWLSRERPDMVPTVTRLRGGRAGGRQGSY